MRGDLDAVPDDIYVRHYGNVKRIAKDHMAPPADLPKEHRVGYWFWGKTRRGKTHAAHAKWPKAYRKMCNKWWDGYQG